MNCKKCGSVLDVNDIVCKNCGEPVNNMNAQPVNNMNAQVGGVNPAPVNPQPVVNDPAVVVNPSPMPASEGQVNPQMVNQVENPNPVQQPNVQSAPVNNMNTQPAAGTPSPAPEKKKSSPIFIVLVVLLVGVIGFLGYKMLSKDKDTGSSSSTPSSNESGSTVSDNSVAKSDVVISYKDFEFPIINNYEASIDEGNLFLVNKADKIVIEMYVIPFYTVDDVLDEIGDDKSFVTNLGLTISNEERKKISGVDWKIYNCTGEADGVTVNVVFAFVQLGEYNSVELMIVNYGSKSMTTIMEDVSKMITGTTYKGTKNFASGEKPAGEFTIKKDFSYSESLVN